MAAMGGGRGVESSVGGMCMCLNTLVVSRSFVFY